MPLRSWECDYDGHTVRFEVWWRYTGWSRRQLFIDHELAVQRCGYFELGAPLRSRIRAVSDQTLPVSAWAARCFRFWRVQGHIEVGSRDLASERTVRLEKKWSHAERDDGISTTGLTVDWPLGCLVIVPLLLVALSAWIILVVPVMLVAALCAWLGEVRQVGRLRKAGRYLPWEEVDARMRQGPSTLIIQSGGLSSLRFWWTDEDILEKSPLPPVETCQLLWYGNGAGHPFVSWCHHVYLAERTGKAHLTSLPRVRLGEFFGNAASESWRAEYPQLRVVETTVPSHDERSIATFVGMLGANLEESVPLLVRAVQEETGDVRALALDALRVAGPLAQAASAVLREWLYHGPWLDRYEVARALAALGPDAIAALQEAARKGDPYVRVPAESALHAVKNRPDLVQEAEP